MVQIDAIVAFINEVMVAIEMIALKDFMMRYRERFCPDLDLTFMDYFLQLSKRENRNKFIVHHDKLFEYGITITTESSKVKQRIDLLELVESVDYRLAKVSEPVKQGGVVTKNVYHFTPSAFKKILLAARPHARHEINVDRYRDYYLFLEEVVGYYNEYQQLHKDRRNAMLTDENKTLSDKIDAQTKEMKKHTKKMKKQTKEIKELKTMTKQLIVYGHNADTKLEEVKTELKDMNGKLSMLFEFWIDFAKLTLPMWMGSSVMHTQFKNLVQGNTIKYAMEHMKMMFVVGFADGNELIVYYCCRNFAEVPKRLSELYRRHITTAMLMPQVICLISCEINTEATILGRMGVFPSEYNCRYLRKRKAFSLTLNDGTNHQEVFSMIVSNSQNENFQGYQSRREEILNNEDYTLNEQIIQRIKSTDQQFHISSRPFCQEYLECFIQNDDGALSYRTASRKREIRNDVDDAHVSDKDHKMLRLKQFLENDTCDQSIDDMVSDGLLTKDDIKAMKKIAEVENIDISHIEFPDSSSDATSDNESDDSSDSESDTESVSSMPELLTDNENDDDATDVEEDDGDESGYDTE